MSISKRDYTAIAAAIASENEWTGAPFLHVTDAETIKYLEMKRTLLADKIAEALQSTNPRFNRELFLHACKLSSD